MKLNKSIVIEVSESKKNTSEILDHVIAIQLDKIEWMHGNGTTPISEITEKAMENMIKLLELKANKK